MMSMTNLKKRVQNLLRDLHSLGFGDDDAQISGARTVDTINAHLYELEDAAGDPDDRPTNVDIVVNIMENSMHGPLAQLFIIEAIQKYADACAVAKVTDFGQMPMIHPQAWINTAKSIQAELAEAYKR